jgi:4-carboxymuconolactone decarboxylase
VSVDELKKIMIHVIAYWGTPAGRQSFLAANASLKTRKG